jgi:hypothetical protein
MATAKEESTLEKVERELADFTSKKAEAEALLKDELTKAQTEYDALVKEINAKYKVDEFEEDIKRHTYFLKLLKGEVAIPDDLNAKKGNVKVKGFKIGSTQSSGDKTRVTDWPGKIAAALSKIDKSVSDKPTPKEVKAAVVELNPSLKFEDASFNSAWNKYKKDNQ